MVVLRVQCCGGGEHDHAHGHGSDDDDDDDDDDEEVEEHPLDSLAGLVMPADHVQALAKLLGFHGETQVRRKKKTDSFQVEVGLVNGSAANIHSRKNGLYAILPTGHMTR